MLSSCVRIPFSSNSNKLILQQNFFFSTLLSFGWRIFLVLKLPTLPCLTEEGVKSQLSEIFLFQFITDPPQFDMPQ